MNPMRLRVIQALRLAQRPTGVTAGELAEQVGCSLQVAERTLAAMRRDGVLEAEVPERKGRPRGDWRIVYRVANGGGHLAP